MALKKLQKWWYYIGVGNSKSKSKKKSDWGNVVGVRHRPGPVVSTAFSLIN